MKISLLIFLLVTNVYAQEKSTSTQDKRNRCTIDITEIIMNSKDIADKEFKQDFTGQKYQRKSWKVYDSFINKKSYYDILASSTEGFSIAETNCGMSLLTNDSISLVQSKLVFAKNPFNQVELQLPYYSLEKNAFSTIVWIRDQSWMSGFCILVFFTIENNVCKFISGEPFMASDI